MIQLSDTNGSHINNHTPKEIIEWLLFPYKYFTNKYHNENHILLDIACGSNIQKQYIYNSFKKVISIDNDVDNIGTDEIYGDILNIPLSNQSVDISFCFETIEHLENQKKAISELYRVTKNTIIIGSVNKYGPEYINNIMIYKNGLNPYHINELDDIQFKKLFNEFNNIEYFNSQYADGIWCMKNDLNRMGYSNYIVINKN